MRRAVLSGWKGHVLALALVVLSVCVGFCLFDGHSHDSGEHRVAFDLCLGLALVAAVPIASFTSVLIHPVPVEWPLAVRLAALHAPDPPPKSPSRF